MTRPSLDEALTDASHKDPTFTPEIWKLLAPVRDRFFQPPVRTASDDGSDGLLSAPPFMTEPDLRQVAMQLAELALDHGVDVDVPLQDDGSSLLHLCVLLRETNLAVENVEWLFAHGANHNQTRADGETPLSLAVKLGRGDLVQIMRTAGRAR